jgi:hypothetical protein
MGINRKDEMRPKPTIRRFRIVQSEGDRLMKFHFFRPELTSKPFEVTICGLKDTPLMP